MRHLVHCWALRMGNRAFAVFFGKGWLGLLSCACCSACDILNCQPFDLAFSALSFRFSTPVPFGPHIHAAGKEPFLVSSPISLPQIK